VTIILVGCAQSSKGDNAGVPIDPSMTAEQAVYTQLLPCWDFDVGVKHPENYAIRERVSIRPDGTVSNVDLLDKARLTDPIYLALSEQVLRAATNPSCQPLRFPPGKFKPQVDLTFDLEKAINGGY
jgi:hypothetical protein